MHDVAVYTALIQEWAADNANQMTKSEQDKPMKRREFIKRSTVLSAASLQLARLSPVALIGRAYGLEPGQPLPIPDVIECGTDTEILEASAATHEFLSGAKTRTWGFNQSYLGPVLRLKRGSTAKLSVKNNLPEPITAHWHGLQVEGNVDGGPHSAFAHGETWKPELDIDQPAATLWYHSHVHGRTAEQVYAGLAGMLIIEDPDAPPTQLPESYGEDDIPLIIQDRAFDDSAQLAYFKRGPSLMHGFRAGEIVVNGSIRPTASVPMGLVRLRLLNASNARIYRFSFDDNRQFHQIASDGGLLQKPQQMNSLMLAPAERAEIVVDFSSGLATRLLSEEDYNSPMGSGMMSQMMGGGFGPPVYVTDKNQFEVMTFNVDKNKPGYVQALPKTLGGAPTHPDWGEPVRRRRFALQMHAGSGGMGGMMGRGNTTKIMGINGEPMDMNRINTRAKVGETELWQIESEEMAHPFHVHGTQFQVLTHNGQAVSFENTGLKDVFLVDGKAEILVRFTRKADENAPYMYHCHILEHEDAGMMGQLTVS